MRTLEPRSLGPWPPEALIPSGWRGRKTSKLQSMKTSWISVTSIVCLLSTLQIHCARHFKLEGMVVTVEPRRQTVVISHDEIPGYMPAMVMPFHIKNENELGGLQPGTRVNLQLVVGRKNSFVKKVRVQQRSTDKLKILPARISPKNPPMNPPIMNPPIMMRYAGQRLTHPTPPWVL